MLYIFTNAVFLCFELGALCFRGDYLTGNLPNSL